MTERDFTFECDAGGVARRNGKWHVASAGHALCVKLGEEIERLQAECSDNDAAFDIQWAASQRAIKRWQKATGRTRIWPDTANLDVWLIGEIERLEAENADLRGQIENLLMKIDAPIDG